MRVYHIDYTDSNGVEHRPEIVAERHLVDSFDGLRLYRDDQETARFSKASLEKGSWWFTDEPEPAGE